MTLLALAAMNATPDPEPDPPDLPATSLIHSTTQLVLDWTPAQTLVDVEDVPGTYYTVREQDDIIYDPAAAPARRWMHYFSAAPNVVASNGQCHIWATFSPDRASWSTPVQCTVSGSPLVGEDPSICQTLTSAPQAHRDNGRLVMYAENPTGINVYSSTDGTAWTLDQQNVINRVSDTWESTLAGSPCARWNGAKYLVTYEGISGTVESSGIATGPTRTALTKSTNNPILTAAGLGFGISGNNSAFIDAMWLTPAGDRIMVTGHAGYNGTGAVTMFRAYTTNLDPATWQTTDFTLIGMVDPVRNDLTCDWWGDRLVTAPADDLSIVALPLKAP